MPLSAQVRRIVFSRKGRWMAGCAAVALAALLWGGNSLIRTRFEKSLKDGAAKRGMTLEWRDSSWDPWRGIHLSGLRLRQREGGGAAIAELENLNLSLPLNQVFAGAGRKTRWTSRNSDVVLHDPAGAVKLDNVSVDLTVGSGEMDVERFSGGAAGLTTRLAGKIIFSRFRTDSTAAPVLNLRPIRATLATLDVNAGTGPFHVTGNFTIDLRNGERHWITSLGGTGRDLEWKGVRWKSATARATMSSTTSEIRYDLETANGSTSGTVFKEGWHDSPFKFEGNLVDSQGRKNKYHGSHHRRVLTVEDFSGDADLFLLSRDIPALASWHPENVSFKTFPTVNLRELVWDHSSGTPRWSFASLEAATQGSVSVSFSDKKMELQGLTVKVTHDGEKMIVRKSTAGIFNGRIGMTGTYRDGVLRDANIKVEDVGLAEIKRMFAKSRRKPGPGILSVDFHGDVDLRKKLADGQGSMRLENAPVLEIPLLDQVYDIFTQLIPGIERSEQGTFDARFKIKGDAAEITKFEARGGSLTVTAVGEVDLNKRHVTGRARGKLVGLPGMVTSPLSRLLEMEVSGPYDNIRIKPIGPAKLASDTASGTVGVMVDAVEETGKIAGAVLTEGVKLPLRLFQNDEDRKKETD